MRKQFITVPGTSQSRMRKHVSEGFGRMICSLDSIMRGELCGGRLSDKLLWIGVAGEALFGQA